MLIEYSSDKQKALIRLCLCGSGRTLLEISCHGSILLGNIGEQETKEDKSN